MSGNTDSHNKQQSHAYTLRSNESSSNKKSWTESSVRNLSSVIDSQVSNSFPQSASDRVNTSSEIQTERNGTLFQYSKVLQLEHAVTNFIDGLRKIVALSPNLHVYNDIIENQHNKIPVETLPALSRYKLKLGSELVSLHDLGKLDVLDQILDYAQDFNKQGSSDPSPLILSNSEYKDLVELDDMKEVEKKLSLTSTNSSDQLDKLKTKDEDSKNLSEDEESDDGKSTKEKDNKSGNNAPVWPPKLPQIKNPAIAARVFIHKSIINDKLYLSETDMLNAHNERLEFLGDAILNTTVTMMLYNKFPHLTEGNLSQLRMRLINNERLKEWSFLYGFEQKLKANLDSKTRAGSHQTYFQQGKQKLYSDVFEAYIGGLIEDNPKKNLPKVRKWLEKLAAPVITEHIKSNAPGFEEEIDVNAKKTLYSLIGYAALNLHYVTVHRPTASDPDAVVECRIKDEVVLGRGTGKNVKIAGMRAAQNVLSNKELVEKYANLRASIPREESMAKPDVPGKVFQNPTKFTNNQPNPSFQSRAPFNQYNNGFNQSSSPSNQNFISRNNRAQSGSPPLPRLHSSRNANQSGSVNNNGMDSNKRIKISKDGSFVLE